MKLTFPLFKLGFLIFVLFIGCNKERRKAIPDEFKTISIDVEKSMDFPLSDFVKDIKYIPLETNQESVISAIDKIYSYKDEFYILDKKQNAIVIFSTYGSYIRKFKKQGKGNGEYLQITDFSIDMKNGTLLILDNISKTYHLYTSKGEHIKSSKIKNT